MFRRHYSARKTRPKIRQFVGPGEKMVLTGWMLPALFVWRKEAFRRDGQVGVNCAVFRNESLERSSDMILEAMDFAFERWPGQRLYTFINAAMIQSRNPGYCFKKAGWTQCGKTKLGLVILEYTHEQPREAGDDSPGKAGKEPNIPLCGSLPGDS